MSKAEPARIQLHPFMPSRLQAPGKCGICEKPRLPNHTHEFIAGAEGEKGQAVEIQQEKR